MIKKVYENIKLILRENYKMFFFLIFFYIILTIPLPYYIHTTGGLIDISSKVEIEDEYNKSGSINLSYVTEMRGNVLTYLLSFVIPNWDLVSQENYVSSNETYEDVEYRNHMLLEEANANAMIVAYNEAQKKVDIKGRHFYIVYVDEKADTTLKVGDEIKALNGIDIKSFNDYINIVSNSKIGDNLSVTVIQKNNKETVKTAKVFSNRDKNVTGIMIATDYDYEADPKISFSFKKSESGPSGGLMMSLAIYNKLVKEDLTKGLTIVGTGTIDKDGNVGEISGIEYKIKGAVAAKADIFLAPLGSNYDDAMEIVKKNKYNIKIVGVLTFADAINYLRRV